MLSLTNKLRDPIWGFNVVLMAVVLTASATALRLAFQLGYDYHLFGCTRLVPIDCFVSFRGSYFLGVTLALGLSAIGLWLRRVLGFLLSLIALTFLGTVYVAWYLGTLSSMEMFGVRDFSQNPEQAQYLLPLQGATWWDIVVLGVALLVFIWQAVMLRHILKPTKMVSENQTAAESDRGREEPVR